MNIPNKEIIQKGMALDSKMLNKKSPKHRKEFTFLQKQAHADLILRARGGIVIYFVVWVITAFWATIPKLDFSFFIFNTLIFISISLIRLFHYYSVSKNPKNNTRQMYNLLVTMILIGACHWGLLSAYIIYISDYQILHYPYMIIIPAFAIGGTGILSISKLISIAYPLLMFVPIFISGIIIGGTEDYILIMLAVISIAYVLEASRVSNKDYHKAIFNHKVAESRAKQMELLSITDQLTSLKNRMYFNIKYTKMWRNCSENQLPLCIIMIDLDHFKSINDTYGHIAGDHCLKKVAEVLKFEMREDPDAVARFGGEEFIILLPKTNTIKSCEIAKRLVSAVAGIKLVFKGRETSIKCSIGVACMVPSLVVNEDQLLIAADQALYQAKNNGRNQYCLSENMQAN